MAGHGLVHWFETAIPILLVVWITEFDVSIALIGVVVAIGYAPFGLGALPSGILADRYGPRRLVLACMGGMSVAFLVVAVAGSIWTVGLGLMIWGIAASLYHPAGLSLISTGVRRRGNVFAWHGIAGNFGIALGPLTTAILLIWFDWSIVTALLAIPGIIAFVLGLRATFDPYAAVEVDRADAAENGITIPSFLADTRALFASSFVLVFVLVTFEGLFYRGMLTYLPEIMHGLEAIGEIGVGESLEGFEPSDFIYVGLLVVGMLGQYVGGIATDRIPSSMGLLGGFVALAVLALAFVPFSSAGLGPLLVWAAIVGVVLFGIQPFYQNAVAVYTPADGRGLSYGYTYLGEFGLGATSVAIGGFVLGAYTVAAFFAVLSFFAIGGAVFSAVLWGLGRPQSDS